MAGQLVSLGDGGGGQAQGGNAGAIGGADGQVTRDCQRFGRQGWEAHRVAPVVEQPPLGGVDTLGVFGEDRLQGVGHALIGGAQGRR